MLEYLNVLVAIHPTTKARGYSGKRFIKKGALSAQLAEEKNIPSSLLDEIVDSDVGETIKTPKGEITVTPKLKKRVYLAKTLKRIG